ncbi:hypothetical protein [Pseudomonas mandelii]|uniref:hypothetical protein n=1 Tax=Pseudomonas mandelii TaxID=75612 RepID=UPI00224ACF52|nr:hypothetical protein [Pseudomonas mandelii]MCX2898121.1 hypothetical protein [Pseudomonas mandelii]
MSLVMTIFSMIASWMAIAAAMLWGMLRIARRHLTTETCTDEADHSGRSLLRGQRPAVAMYRPVPGR